VLTEAYAGLEQSSVLLVRSGLVGFDPFCLFYKELRLGLNRQSGGRMVACWRAVLSESIVLSWVSAQVCQAQNDETHYKTPTKEAYLASSLQSHQRVVRSRLLVVLL